MGGPLPSFNIRMQRGKKCKMTLKLGVENRSHNPKPNALPSKLPVLPY